MSAPPGKGEEEDDDDDGCGLRAQVPLTTGSLKPVQPDREHPWPPHDAPKGSAGLCIGGWRTLGQNYKFQFRPRVGRALYRVSATLKVLFTRQLEFHSGTVHKYTNFKHSLGLTKPFNNKLFLVSQPATVR